MKKTREGLDKQPSQSQLAGRMHEHEGEGKEDPSSPHISDWNGNKHTTEMQEGLAENKSQGRLEIT